MMVTDAGGTPRAARIESASPAEVKLIETTLGKIAVTTAEKAARPGKRPDRLLADKA